VLLSPGDAAPDFEVSDHTGATRRLSEFRGKPVVLWFYPKANTFG
jgi:peroxiredoxin Q/BCP